jgi:hypothetical protein
MKWPGRFNPDFSHWERFMTQMLGFVRLLRTEGNTGGIIEVLKSLINAMIKSEIASSVRNPG